MQPLVPAMALQGHETFYRKTSNVSFKDTETESESKAETEIRNRLLERIMLRKKRDEERKSMFMHVKKLSSKESSDGSTIEETDLRSRGDEPNQSRQNSRAKSGSRM